MTDAPLSHLFTGGTKWRTVSEPELELWLAEYPRDLTPDPPLSQKRFQVRYWIDPTLGEGEAGQVAMINKSRRHSFCQVLKDVPMG